MLLVIFQNKNYSHLPTRHIVTNSTQKRPPGLETVSYSYTGKILCGFKWFNCNRNHNTNNFESSIISSFQYHFNICFILINGIIHLELELISISDMHKEHMDGVCLILLIYVISVLYHEYIRWVRSISQFLCIYLLSEPCMS